MPTHLYELLTQHAEQYPDAVAIGGQGDRLRGGRSETP
jgi:hypothetical protein